MQSPGMLREMPTQPLWLSFLPCGAADVAKLVQSPVTT